MMGELCTREEAAVEIISIPAGVNHLSIVMEDLPSNCIFDKGRVGCGATTVALSNDRDYVIAVPYLVLIQSKVDQCEPDRQVLGVTGETREAEILTYLEQSSVKKIMVTYDSLPKLLKYINPADYSLLVDEYHDLFIQYLLREKAIKGVLENYTKFRNYRFMSATALESEYVIEELEHLPIVKAEWEVDEVVNVHLIECVPNVYELVERVIKAFLRGDNEGNAYIFVNSVEFIREMVHRCDLKDENTRAIWGTSTRRGVGLRKGTTTEPAKKINLLTSTCFEGADLYDKEGRIFIVSDGRRGHTQVDITTAFRQIAGRIRDSDYKDDIYLLYTRSRSTTSLTYEEYQEDVKKQIAVSKANVEEYNTKLSAEARKPLPVHFDDYFISKVPTDEGSIYLFDPNKVRLQLFEFKKTHVLYGSREKLGEELEASGYKIVRHKPYHNINKSTRSNRRIGLREVVEELKKVHDATNSEDKDFADICSYATPLHKAAFERFDFLEAALKTYRFEGIAEMGYRASKIRRRLIADSDKPLTDKIISILREHKKFTYGTYVSSKEVKRIFGEIYQELSIKKKPKGTDILKYYEVKENNKQGRGFIIKQPRHIIEAEE